MDKKIIAHAVVETFVFGAGFMYLNNENKKLKEELLNTKRELVECKHAINNIVGVLMQKGIIPPPEEQHHHTPPSSSSASSLPSEKNNHSSPPQKKTPAKKSTQRGKRSKRKKISTEEEKIINENLDKELEEIMNEKNVDNNDSDDDFINIEEYSNSN